MPSTGKGKLRSRLHPKNLFSAASRSHSPQPPPPPQDAQDVSILAPTPQTSTPIVDPVGVVSSASNIPTAPLDGVENQQRSSPRLASMAAPIAPVVHPSSGEIQAVSAEGNSISDVATVGFEGCKTVLRLIERGAGVFPPLKSTAACLLGLIDIVEKTRQNREDSAELGQKLERMVAVVERHRHASETSPISHRLNDLSVSIELQMSVIRSKSTHGIMRSAAEVTKDADDIVASYRAIAFFADEFMMDTTLAIEHAVQRNLSHTLLESLRPATHAAYNASDRRNACTKNTRTAVLARNVAWAVDRSTNKTYWMSGMAGLGKTTISYSFSEVLEKCGMLGATFFCSRLDVECSKVDRIIPTILYQLAGRFPAVHESILTILESDKEAGTKSIRLQFRDLLTPVLTAASSELSKRPVIIIIDALDECSNLTDVQLILSMIAHLSVTLPVKFFLTSRPEKELRTGFHRKIFPSLDRFNLHDIEGDIVQADIRLYITEKLLQISECRSEISGSGEDWPPEHELTSLVEQAGKLFIYAATACEYINQGGNIKSRLSAVTNIRMKGGRNQIDALYSDILTRAYDRADDEGVTDIKAVLRAVITAPSVLSAHSLSILTNRGLDRVWSALALLHSVISMPQSRDPHAFISTFHASFPDYLMDEKRAGRFFLNYIDSQSEVALECLRVMHSSIGLRQNICNLQACPENADIPPLAITEHTSDVLTHSCLYWPTHVFMTSALSDANELHDQVNFFFAHHNLHWIEYLSLIGRLEVAVSSLAELERWAQRHPHLLLAIFDTRRLVMENFDLIKHSPLETYSSALIWLPEDSLTRARYTKLEAYRYLCRVLCGQRKAWGACELILDCHSPVNSVAFSPDGSRVVSASHETTVRIWNARTGDLEAVLEGHTDGIKSVIFSPDGSHLLSASMDGTTRLWNVETGDSYVTASGNENGVMPSVVFSPDGCRVAVASSDRTVQVCNVATGKSEAVFGGHTENVASVAFSPDSSRIASASADGTVRIWNTVNGRPEADLVGHTNRITSVAFSPNGSRVATGSSDGTLRVWNAVTGNSVAVLEGHSMEVTRILFSPDSNRIASGSADCTVRVWNTETGKLDAVLSSQNKSVRLTSVEFSSEGSRVTAQWDETTVVWNAANGDSEGHTFCVPYSALVSSPNHSHFFSISNTYELEIRNLATGDIEAAVRGHTGAINSIAFSSDGNRIASASSDKTVRIWNAETGQPEAILEGHTAWVACAVFSPDGSRIVSGSGDRKVRIWNATTGNSEAILDGHAEVVTSVAFSPNGSCIASASRGNMLRIWNAATGNPEAILHGHTEDVKSVVFSSDGSHVVSVSKDDDTIQLWNLATGDSKIVPEGGILPDCSCIIRRAYCRSMVGPHVIWVYLNLNPVKRSNFPSPISVSDDRKWVVRKDDSQLCSISPSYRSFTKMASFNSLLCLGYESGRVVILDTDPVNHTRAT